MNSEQITGSLGVKREHALDGTAVLHRASHTDTALAPQSANLHVFWAETREIRENSSKHREVEQNSTVSVI